MAPGLLANDDRSAAPAAGELIATAALPRQVPRAVDADAAGTYNDPLAPAYPCRTIE